MAINPPTDIVLDVVNAADPARIEMAQAKLKAGQAAFAAQRLSGTDASFEANVVRDHRLSSARLEAAEKKDTPEAYRKFEAIVLQNFVKNMLPDSDELYGKGATGEIWKGMMAEQLANEMARGKGIGIADQLAVSGSTRMRDKSTSNENRADRLHMATRVIDTYQMRALDNLLPGSDTDTKKVS